MREIYVSTTFIKDKSSVFKAIDLLKKIKVKNVEIGSNHKYQKNITRLKKYQFNYFVHNYFPVPKKDFIVNIASNNDQIRKKSINHIKKSISFTKFVGGKLYTFHPGFFSDPSGASIDKTNYDFLFKKKFFFDQKYKKNSYKKMVISIKEIIRYSKKHKVNIAIETEGSFKSKDHLMMQLPKDFTFFRKNFSHKDIGINLNLAHLNLAAKAFKFKKTRFVNSIKKYIVAVELSHNYKNEDSHKPLLKNSWYFKFINSHIPKGVPIILEFRNSRIDDVKSSIRLIKKLN